MNAIYYGLRELNLIPLMLPLKDMHCISAFRLLKVCYHLRISFGKDMVVRKTNE